MLSRDRAHILVSSDVKFGIFRILMNVGVIVTTDLFLINNMNNLFNINKIKRYYLI